jgi:hypothetical protein
MVRYYPFFVTPDVPRSKQPTAFLVFFVFFVTLPRSVCLVCPPFGFGGVTK